MSDYVPDGLCLDRPQGLGMPVVRQYVLHFTISGLVCHAYPPSQGVEENRTPSVSLATWTFQGGADWGMGNPVPSWCR